MSDTKELNQEEVALRFKKANAAGFINHMITAAGATQEQAVQLFNKSDEKATQLLNKRAAIRESILAELSGKTKSATAEGLPANLGNALSS